MSFELTHPKQTSLALVAPFLAPETGRAMIEIPAGLTIDAILSWTLRGGRIDRQHLRVILVSDTGRSVVLPEHWARVRPKPGIRVIIRVIPGKDAIRSVLLAVVSIAAVSLGGFLGAALVPTAGIAQTLVSTVIGAGLSVVGSLLVGALIPLEQPQGLEAARDVYQVSGWRNRAALGEAVPLVLGTMRYAPPLAAQSYTEIAGDQQFVRALFCFGYGPLDISALRIGQTPIEEFEDVELEIREGRPDDLPLTLYNQQVLEEVVNLELIRPFPQDDLGNPQRGEEALAKPRIWRTGENAARINVIFSFPNGIFRVGGSTFAYDISVELQLRFRLVGTTDWVNTVRLNIPARSQREQFWRQYTWTTPTRGVWEIEIERLSPSDRGDGFTDASFLAAVQTIRLEQPIAINTPMALVAVRVRATKQLNGALDDFNALATRLAPVLQADGSWPEGPSSNPASITLAVLMGDANPFPVAEAEIDWTGFAEWFSFCAEKGLRFNAARDQATSLRDLLAALGSAGRAAIRHDGVRWTPVIDRPTDLVIDHINPRNSSGLTWQEPYFDPPDGFRVPFLDETRDYQPAERIVPWPGFEGVPELTETVELPGKTHPDEVWIEARRKQYELMHRSGSVSVVQDGAARVATRGDQVMVNHDVLEASQLTARVTRIEGDRVFLDEPVQMVTGGTYAIRFTAPTAEGDLLTVRSYVQRVVTDPGRKPMVRLAQDEGGSDPLPQEGWLVHFGDVATESFAMKIRGIEAGEDLSASLDLVPAAPEIDFLTDAEVPPPWDGRVGDPTQPNILAPGVPRIVSVSTSGGSRAVSPSTSIYLGPEAIRIDVEPSDSRVAVALYSIEHREPGADAFEVTEFLASNGGVALEQYTGSDTIEFRVTALTENRIPSPRTALVTFTRGTDQTTPDAIDAGSISIEPGLGHATITLATGEDEATEFVQIYRVPTGVELDRDVHAVGQPYPVQPLSTFTIIDGDATRSNILADGGFDQQGAWSTGMGWMIESGAAMKVLGAASALSQALSLTEARTYRLAGRVITYVSGTLEPRVEGAPDGSDTAIDGAGPFSKTITAPASPTGLALFADAAFEGSIDDIVLFEQSARSLPAGDWAYFVEPLTGQGLAGPLSGPFNVTII